jgi:hypothetical protein
MTRQYKAKAASKTSHSTTAVLHIVRFCHEKMSQSQGLFQLVTRIRKEYQAGHFYARDQGRTLSATSVDVSKPKWMGWCG